MIRRSFQKGHISKRRTQHGVVYDIRYRVRKAEGGWRQLCETLHDLGDGRAGRDKAEEMLQARLREAHGASGLALLSTMKLEQFINTQWRQYLDRKAVKPSTRASYQAYLSKHIMPEIGDLEIADITPFHIGELLAKKGSEGLAARSVHHMYRLLDTIFRLAVDNDLVHRSPVRKHHRPEYAKVVKVAWSPEQFRRLLAEIPPTHQALVATVALLGARIGEILGLQWKHVNFSTGEITIRQSLWRGKLQTTKTENSVRIMPMSEFLLMTLLRHKRESVHAEPDNYVFCHGDGRPFDPDVLRSEVLYPAIERAGLPRENRSRGWHSFRHTASTLIYRETRDLKSARMYLGHADEKTTELYTHVNRASPEAARALEQALFGDLLQTVTRTGSEARSVRPN